MRSGVNLEAELGNEADKIALQKVRERCTCSSLQPALNTMHDFALGIAASSTRRFGTSHDCVFSYLPHLRFLNSSHVIMYVRR